MDKYKALREAAEFEDKRNCTLEVDPETIFELLRERDELLAQVKRWEDHEVEKALCCVANEKAVARYKEAVAVMREGLSLSRDELGVPQPGYPAPVANACEAIGKALAKVAEILKGIE